MVTKRIPSRINNEITNRRRASRALDEHLIRMYGPEEAAAYGIHARRVVDAAEIFTDITWDEAA